MSNLQPRVCELLRRPILTLPLDELRRVYAADTEKSVGNKEASSATTVSSSNPTAADSTNSNISIIFITVGIRVNIYILLILTPDCFLRAFIAQQFYQDGYRWTSCFTTWFAGSCCRTHGCGKRTEHGLSVHGFTVRNTTASRKPAPRLKPAT